MILLRFPRCWTSSNCIRWLLVLLLEEIVRSLPTFFFCHSSFSGEHSARSPKVIFSQSWKVIASVVLHKKHTLYLWLILLLLPETLWIIVLPFERRTQALYTMLNVQATLVWYKCVFSFFSSRWSCVFWLLSSMMLMFLWSCIVSYVIYFGH